MMLILYLLAALALAISIDATFGDPRNRYHPVSWLGRIIDLSVMHLKSTNSMSTERGGNGKNTTARRERMIGIIYAIYLTTAIVLLVHFAALLTLHLVGALALLALTALILKVTIAVKGMERHALSILCCLAENNIASARSNLAMIVRRDTDDLDAQHVLSATIECVSESTVDGITSPLFYFSLLGPAGAIGYRVINTLDSMIGYKDEYFCNIGWMSAKFDTAANYIPARITAFFMIASSMILGADWKNSVQILKRDRAKTFSTNGGYPMATMAGALRVRLEKIGHYSLGEEQEPISVAKCKTAISIMKLTTSLFCFGFVAPIMTILYLIGWWSILFGV